MLYICFVIKQTLHKMFSVVLALLVLISTLSFSIDQHYCGGTLIDTAIFKKAKTCGMEMQKSSTNEDSSIMKNNCCKEEQLVVKGQDELKISFDKLTFEKHFFVASFVHSYLNLFKNFEENAKPFSEYPPPLIVKSIYKLDETYLI